MSNLTQEAQTANALKHIINTPSMKIEISLDDDCKNGHNDFSMTGTVWESGKPHTERNIVACGCIHDDILKFHPKLKLFGDLHLCNAQGVPMYAEANGFYHLKESGKKAMQKYMRATDEQAEILAGAEDQQHFLYLIHSLGLPAQWKAEADQAIEMLQEWTGKIFVDNSTRGALNTLSQEETENMEFKISSGYYSPENKAIRLQKKIADAKQKAIDEVNEDYNKNVKNVKNENNKRLVKLAVLNCGLPLDNFIYYTHTNEGCFNWNTSSYTKAITSEQFEKFSKDVQECELPGNVKFKLKLN